MNSIYRKPPAKIVENIPVFSDLDDPYVKNYEKIATDHLEHLQRTGKSPFMADDQIIESNTDTLDILRKYVPKGSKVLDAGVGYGLLLSKADEYEKFGVDVAIPYLKIAQSNGIITSMSMLEDLPFHDGTFDAVVTCDVLEHVFGLDRVLSELIRVIRDGGYLIVRVPNEERLDGYLTDDQPYAHSHVRSFNLTSLRLLFEKCLGLQFVDHAYTGHFFGISSQLRYPCVSIKDPLHEKIKFLLSKNKKLTKNPYFKSIIKLADISTEEMVDAVLGLRKTEPSLYEALSNSLIKSAEIIVVFKISRPEKNG